MVMIVVKRELPSRRHCVDAAGVRCGEGPLRRVDKRSTENGVGGGWDWTKDAIRWGPVESATVMLSSDDMREGRMEGEVESQACVCRRRVEGSV
jgi:hypothetical protein